MIRAIRSELLKIRTTHTWWLMLLGLVGYTALAFSLNALRAHFVFTEAEGADIDPAGEAANLYTSGQYIGLMLAMLLGVLVVINEFHHQTASATFLATPKRLRVMVAKLVTVVGWGTLYAVITMAIAVPATLLFLNSEGRGNFLDDGDVVAAMVLNVPAYALWAVLGLGLGSMIRSQVGALILTLILYLVGDALVQIVRALAFEYELTWLEDGTVLYPVAASRLLVSAASTPIPYWIAAFILLGYGIAAAVVGTSLLRYRDVS